MENLILILSGVSLGFFIHLSLVFSGEKWADNFHYKITFTLLPFIAMVISKVIAGNIALSLGMVGALSIVRFRNPVKNPFELVLYFALLTLGITLGVKLLWGIAFALIIILIILISNFFKSKTSISFQEGKEIYSIEIKTKNEINNLLENRNLKTYTEFSDENNIKNFVYFLCYNEKEKIMNEATKLKTLIKDKDAHIQINL